MRSGGLCTPRPSALAISAKRVTVTFGYVDLSIVMQGGLPFFSFPFHKERHWVINSTCLTQGLCGMESKEQQLTELLGLTARTLTHLTASMTSMSFELLRSNDEITRSAGRRMIDRMATISSGLDEHWRLIGELTGVHVTQEQIETVHELQMQHKPVVPISGAS
jgi:hypothetical protein